MSLADSGSVVFIDWLCDPRRPGKSGLSDLVWDMAPRLVQRGWPVTIVAPYRRGPVTLPGLRIATHVAPAVGYRNIVGNLLLVAMAAWRVRTLPTARLIHTVDYVSTAIAAVACRQPVVLTTPGNIFERVSNVNHFDPTVTFTYKVAARLTAERASAVIATSREMRRWWLRTGASPTRTPVIPLGVDTDKFRPLAGARVELGQPAAEPTILFVGRLQRENGVEAVVRALPAVRAEVPGTNLHIVGSGEEQAPLTRLAEQLGVADAIRWHGLVPLERLPLYYAAADLFVLPRLSRVTPRVLFQAMASGCAVVTSRIGGITDFVIDDENGRLVDPRRPDEIAAAAVELLADSGHRRRLGLAARHSAVMRLDWNVVVDRLIAEVYEPVLSDRLLKS